MSEPAPRPVLVTGPTGNVGSAVVATLASRGRPYRRGMRTPRGEHDVPFDFLDPSTWAPALRGCGGLFLLRPPPIGDVEKHLHPLIDAAVSEGVEHIVFLSVVGADRNRYIPHHKVEVHLESCAVAWTFLRAGFFDQNLISAYEEDIRDDDRIFVPAGEGHPAWVDARDVGEVGARCFDMPESRGMAWVLTGTESLGFDAVAALLSAELGRTITYQPAGLLAFLRHRIRRGETLGQAGIVTVLHALLRRDDEATLDPALGSLLGRPPGTMAQFIRDERSRWLSPQ